MSFWKRVFINVKHIIYKCNNTKCVENYEKNKWTDRLMPMESLHDLIKDKNNVLQLLQKSESDGIKAKIIPTDDFTLFFSTAHYFQHEF